MRIHRGKRCGECAMLCYAYAATAYTVLCIQHTPCYAYAATAYTARGFAVWVCHGIPLGEASVHVHAHDMCMHMACLQRGERLRPTPAAELLSL